MAAALHRSTPTPASSLKLNTHVPQSQVSAPVLEFRCMFTHDCHKKSKKWHDGSLRFHTFNRRVMVYDDHKNLVGDLHYRQNDDFAEGLELKLDRPVLVQVEEPLGQTNTDLTPLLGGHRQDANSQPAHPTHPTRANLARINAANSQARPKSIKQLLGASQGRLGRARLPTQSPFEQRQALSDIQTPAEPSPKRRKIGTGKENETIFTPTRPAPAIPVPSTSARPAAPVVAISSDDEPQTHQIPRSTNRDAIPGGRPSGLGKPNVLPPSEASVKPKERNMASSNKEEVSKKQKHRKLPRDHDVQRVSAEPASRRKKQVRTSDNASERTDTPALAPRSRPPSRTLSAASLQSQRRFSSGPRSSLKLASQKARPKLMYRALLTATSTEQYSAFRIATTPTRAQAPYAQDAHSIQAGQPQRPPDKQRRTGLLDIDVFFAASQTAPETASSVTEPQDSFSLGTEQAEGWTTVLDDNRSGRSSEQSRLGNHASEYAVEDDDHGKAPDSPLFVPRTTSQMSSLPSQPVVVEHQGISVMSPNTPRHISPFSMSPVQLSVHEQSGPRSRQECDMGEPQVEAPSSPAFVFAMSRLAQRTSTDENTSIKPAPMPHLQQEPTGSSRAPPSALPDPVSKIKGRLFRRVVSEQLPTSIPMADEFPDDEYLNENLDHFNDPSASTKNINPPEPQPLLQRAASNPVILEKTLIIGASSSPPAEAEEEPFEQQLAPPQMDTSNPPRAPSLLATDAGPWTTAEAFLLFNWWPPGKQKPDYGQGAQTGHRSLGKIEDSASLAIKVGASKKYGSFGSARLVSQR